MWRVDCTVRLPQLALPLEITMPTYVRCVFVFLLGVFAVPVLANEVGIGVDASQYAVLYEGTGGHNLQITNVTVNGNIGVGGTGVVQDNGPSTINGRLDFSAANSGQFHNNNGANVGPTSVNYSVAAVTSALNSVNSLNTSVGAEAGASLAINGNTTVNESSGMLETSGGITYRVFTITSYSSGDGKMLTINGDGSGNPVVFNFSSSLGNINLGGDVTLNGLNDDQVLFNFTGSGKNISLNNNASSFPSLAFQGIILAPGDAISLVNANLDGRVFGGDSSDMQIVSGVTLNAPAVIPEPASLALLGTGMLALGSLIRRRKVFAS
jgi:choice-of-anchor A domain-containing protein